MRADLVGFADAVLSAGCVAAGAGALVGCAWLAGGGVVAVLAAGAFGWAVTLREEALMRGPTSGRGSAGHSGGAQADARRCAGVEAGARATDGGAR